MCKKITRKRSFNKALQSAQLLFGVFFFVIIILTSSTNAQWNTQSPIPTFLDVRGIAGFTDQHVFIATDDNSFDDGGSLFESTDGGINWIQRNIPISLSNPFYGLFFLDSQNGWVYGNDNYRTTDGGITWTQLPFLGSTYFMKFYTINFGLATGNFGRYISRYGGLSWEPSPNDMFAFDFTSDLIGLGVSETSVFRSTDGGATFAPVYNGNAKTVSFLSNTLVVGIADDIFIRSTDGGLTWNDGTPAEGRDHLLAISGNVVLAWGRAGTFPDFDDRIFRSSDGGQSWTDLGEVMDPGPYATPFAFAVPDPHTVVATDGAGNMFYSGAEGQHWTLVFDSPNGLQPGYLSSVVRSLIDAQTGAFGSGHVLMFMTTTGGG